MYNRSPWIFTKNTIGAWRSFAITPPTESHNDYFEVSKRLRKVNWAFRKLFSVFIEDKAEFVFPVIARFEYKNLRLPDIQAYHLSIKFILVIIISILEFNLVSKQISHRITKTKMKDLAKITTMQCRIMTTISGKNHSQFQHLQR